MSVAVSFEGNLTADPELRFTQGGKAVCNFSVAVNERVKQPDGSWAAGDPTYMNCAAWSQLGEDCAGLEKGQRVVVIGAMKQRTWQDKEGKPRTSYDVNADSVGTSLLFTSRDS